MLVLSRRHGESVRIGDDVTVTLLDVKGCTVRLGIAAPKHVPVHREEVYERIKREGHRPALPSSPLQEIVSLQLTQAPG